MFRIGELTAGDHPVMAKDVHVGTNKDKFMFILWTSKTHWKNVKPQEITIESYANTKVKKLKFENTRKYRRELPCPYKLLRKYVRKRRKYKSAKEQFFVFSDNSPVTPTHVRKCLRKMLKIAGFQPMHTQFTAYMLDEAVICSS